MKKAPEAFRTISEVADLLETPAHVLRFWESKFYQIRPVKRAGGRRYYRPDDVALINGIKTLLQDRGMTIRGAQRILQEQGVKAVAQLGLPLPQGGAMLRLVSPDEDDVEDLSIPDDGTVIEAEFVAEEDPTFDVAPALDAEPLARPLPEPEPVPVVQMHPEDEVTMELQPFPGYADPAVEGDDASRSGLEPANDEQSQADGAHAAPDEPESEGVAVSNDDLVAAVADPLPEAAAPAVLPETLTVLLRNRPPAQPETPAQPVEAPTESLVPMRIAQALRAMPRHAPGRQRDRLAILARRIDVLLERMSEASGAGRW